MVDWRGIGYVVGTVVLFVGYTLSTGADLLLLLLGVLPGAVAGYRARTVLWGAVYGLVVGCLLGVILFVGAGYLAVQGPAAPGVGMGLFFVLLVGVFVAVQGLFAGAVGGAVYRLRTG